MLGKLDGVVYPYGCSRCKSAFKSSSCPSKNVYQNVRIALNRASVYQNKEEDFLERLPGTPFQEFMHWRRRSAIPVEIVEVVRGTDSRPSVQLSSQLTVQIPLYNKVPLNTRLQPSWITARITSMTCIRRHRGW
jgi:hypothetical protein